MKMVQASARVPGDDGRAARNAAFGLVIALAAVDRGYPQYFTAMVESARIVVGEELRGCLVVCQIWLMCSSDFFAEILRFLPLSAVSPALARLITSSSWSPELQHALEEFAQPPQRQYPSQVRKSWNN
jgi:hypothetical protein